MTQDAYKEVLSDPAPLATMPSEPLPSPSDWTFELIGEYHRVIRETAQRFCLDTYPNQLEVITAEQMMDAYASVGMPVNYRHWSYGMEFIQTERNYRRGMMGLAYEIVINSDPCIAYLMEENSMAMQALVIAHASYGHNSFFKGNYLFRMWTDAEGIIDYLVYAKEYIKACEEKHGLDAVEQMLDSCHALMNHGVDRYKHPPKLTLAAEKALARERAEHAQKQVNDLWRTIPKSATASEKEKESKRFPEEPQENLLYFIEKYAPNLETWQREVVRIVRKVAQYFYPQRQTQVMNEGWATFWHHHILHTMYDDGYLSDGLMIEFMKSHTNVIRQPGVGERGYGGINPYALGFAMFTDIKRICEGGTWAKGKEGDPANFVPSDPQQLAEDRAWFPDLAGTKWLPALHYAMRNFKDESFIGQYLSPRLIREFRLFAITDDENEDELVVSGIHDEGGYRHVREVISSQYNLSMREPSIEVWSVNRRSDRLLTLRHKMHEDRPLHESSREVLKHIARLWGFGVRIESINTQDEVVDKDECVPPVEN